MYFIAHYCDLHYFVGSSRSFRSALKASMYTWPSYIVVIAQPYLNAKVCAYSSYTNMRTAFKHTQTLISAVLLCIWIYLPFHPAIMAFLCILVRLAIHFSFGGLAGTSLSYLLSSLALHATWALRWHKHATPVFRKQKKVEIALPASVGLSVGRWPFRFSSIIQNRLDLFSLILEQTSILGRRESLLLLGYSIKG